jgi:hypothetical protein
MTLSSLGDCKRERLASRSLRGSSGRGDAARDDYVNVVGKNVVTLLVLLGLAYLFGQGDKAGEIAVTASILAAPIIATLAVENGVAVREMSRPSCSAQSLPF